MADTFDWISWAKEIAERTAGVERSSGARAALADAAAVVQWEEEERRLHEPEAEAWRAVWRALMLARDVETLTGLLRNELVPLDRLDAEWVARLGLREYA